MKPNLLRPGDTIGLIATAKPVTKPQMLPFLALMKDWGLRVLEGKHLYDSHGHFSSTDENRAEDFYNMWQNPKVKAIFCARGGYGSIRILKHLPRTLFQSEPKWVIGYSDITTLHLVLNGEGIPSIHGPMALNVHLAHSQSENNFYSLQRLLFKGEVHINLGKCKAINSKPFNGEVIGGNASLIAASLGTPEQPNTKNKVLFIEEIDEYLYHFDRQLHSMDRAGIFEPLSALIVGGLSKMKDNKVKFGRSAKEIIADICSHYGFPIIFDFPAGHGVKNSSISLGSLCKFEPPFFTQNLK